MTAIITHVDQHRLFTLNRSRPTARVVDEIERLEGDWIEPAARSVVTDPAAPIDLAGLFAGLDDLLARPDPNPSATRFVAEECSLDAFRVLVGDFAADALTEAQSFLPIVGRLPIEARMPVLRVLIDEFGCGNLERAHSNLYIRLLEELGLPTDLDSYLDTTSGEVLAFVNLFYWLAARADNPSWFLGALAHLEASIVEGFRCYVSACKRLGVANSAYYGEHVHIDSFHRREMRTAIALLEQHGTLDHEAAWAGARIAADTFDVAFAAAVTRARTAQ